MPIFAHIFPSSFAIPESSKYNSTRKKLLEMRQQYQHSTTLALTLERFPTDGSRPLKRWVLSPIVMHRGQFVHGIDGELPHTGMDTIYLSPRHIAKLTDSEAQSVFEACHGQLGSRLSAPSPGSGWQSAAVSKQPSSFCCFM